MPTPRVGDRVYDNTRVAIGLQPNGRIRQIFWSGWRQAEQIEVEFLEDKGSSASLTDRLVLYDWEQFDGQFDHWFGGIWMLS